MARFLFVVPPLTGHTNPTVSIASELESRGHQVAWVGHPAQVERLLPKGAHLIRLDDAVPSEIMADRIARARVVRGLSSLKFLWEDFFIPLAHGMVDGVDAAVEEYRPDALIVDQQTLAGGLVARRRGVPWATLATTSATLAKPFETLPKVKEWVDDQLASLERAHGLEPMPEPDLSPSCVLVCSTPDFLGDSAPSGERFVWLGPSVRSRVDDTPFPMDFLAHPQADAPHPAVLVSLGTVNAERGRRFYEMVCEAVTDQPIRVVIAAPDGMIESAPDNVLVRSWVPQLRLLPHLSAVVTHGGHNTVCEALLHGVPMVVAPIKDDQPVVAGLVVDAGAGERVHFGRVKARRFGETLSRVLNDPAYRTQAARIGTSFRQAGGAAAAAIHLERWVTG